MKRICSFPQHHLIYRSASMIFSSARSISTRTYFSKLSSTRNIDLMYNIKLITRKRKISKLWNKNWWMWSQKNCQKTILTRLSKVSESWIILSICRGQGISCSTSTPSLCFWRDHSSSRNKSSALITNSSKKVSTFVLIDLRRKCTMACSSVY